MLIGAGCLLPGQERPGNFSIRFEPAVVLQANAPIPFAITVKDALRHPVTDAKVTLQVETQQRTQVTVFKASATEPGVYVSKPLFPSGGQWSVYVEVRRGDELSARSIDYSVPETAAP